MFGRRLVTKSAVSFFILSSLFSVWPNPMAISSETHKMRQSLRFWVLALLTAAAAAAQLSAAAVLSSEARVPPADTDHNMNAEDSDWMIAELTALLATSAVELDGALKNLGAKMNSMNASFSQSLTSTHAAFRKSLTSMNATLTESLASLNATIMASLVEQTAELASIRKSLSRDSVSDNDAETTGAVGGMQRSRR